MPTTEFVIICSPFRRRSVPVRAVDSRRCRKRRSYFCDDDGDSTELLPLQLAPSFPALSETVTSDVNEIVMRATLIKRHSRSLSSLSAFYPFPLFSFSLFILSFLPLSFPPPSSLPSYLLLSLLLYFYFSFSFSFLFFIFLSLPSISLFSFILSLSLSVTPFLSYEWVGENISIVDT